MIRLLLVILSVINLFSQVTPKWSILQSYTVATLPTAGIRNRTVYVTNAASATSCIIGTGSVVILCRDTGSAWLPAGDGNSAGSGSGILSLNGLTADPQLFAKINDTNVTLTIGSVTDTHTFTLGWTSTLADARIASAATWNAKQTGDATLTALAAYNTNGLLVQTAADTFAGRTIIGTTNQITVTNGNGVAGNPTLSLPSDISITGNISSGVGVTTGGNIVEGNATGDTAASFFEANSGDAASNAEPAYLKLWSSHSTKRKASLFPCTDADGFFCIASGTPAADSAASILVNGGPAGTPSALVLTNATGLPVGSLTGLGTGVGTLLATPTSANLAAAITNETGTGVAVFNDTPTLLTPVLTGLPTGSGVASAATASTLASRDANANLVANNYLAGYTTTATAAGTTTLTVASTQLQFFTGGTTQTVVLPVTSTMALGQPFVVSNNSTGLVTVNSSGGNAVKILGANTSAIFRVILTSGTTAASWDAFYYGVVMTSGKALQVQGSATVTVTDNSTVALGAGGTVLYNGGAGGTPSSLNLSNATALPVGSITGLGANVATALTTPQIVQNSKSAAYTTVLGDCMGSIYHPGADTTARTWTIDSNANVAAPIGCTITFVNDTSGGVITIAITSDTLVLAGAGTTGSRTLAANGVATATKVTSTRWIVNGTGLT